MDAADVKTTDAYRRIREWIEFDSSTGLNPVRVLVVLIEANHDGWSKEGTVSDGSATRERVRKWVGRIVWVSPVFGQPLKPKTCDRWTAGEGKEFCLGVETILERSAGILSVVELRDVGRAAARRFLTGEERCRNNSMEQPKA